MENIFLTGFMGVGKTTVAAILADILKRPVVDLDDLLEKNFGCPIAEFFAVHGEAAFRQRETELLEKVANDDGLIVSTGGGLPVSKHNREIMRDSGQIVLLDMPFDAIADRLEKNTASRPNWKSRDDAQKLFESRKTAYHDCDFTVNAALPPEDVAATILQKISGVESFTADIDGVKLPVSPSFNAPSELAKLIAGKQYSAIVFITDGHVAAAHLPRYQRALPHAISIVIRPGEDSKTLQQAENVYRQLLQLNVGRDALIVAIGGGLVTDFGAFIAATYKRGIDFMLISTSLLGCVDAVVGGKTAVNIAHYKNQVGLFALPKAIFLDLAALATLPEQRIREGLVEAYKTGLVCNDSLMRFIDENLERLVGGDLPLIAKVAATSAHAKAEVVHQDFREKGLRKILNLGHTYGHAVETWSEERISHGLCVAQGMIVAMYIAMKRHYIDADLADNRMEVIRALRGPSFPVPSAEEAFPLMMADKKNTNAKITFILPHTKDGFKLVQDITPAELQDAINAL
ncbi:MAG: bifunctional shikimate kinase/3-dehydroquinate synthase [Victivallales bacterium]|nr:bifunctional shikimate kinase/3-dehydroquinate synthase [Victivallales bacterium]